MKRLPTAAATVALTAAMVCAAAVPANAAHETSADRFAGGSAQATPNVCSASIQTGIINPAGRELFMLKLDCRHLEPGWQARAVVTGRYVGDGQPFEFTSNWVQFAPSTSGKVEFNDPAREFVELRVDYQPM